MQFMRSLLLASAASALAAGSAHADGWIVTIGARAAAAPPYEGAGHDVVAPSPTFTLRRADSPDRFIPPDGGTTLALLSSSYISAGPMVRFRYKRGDADKLTGMKPIDLAIEPGAFVDLWPTSWFRARVEGRHGILGHHGWVGDAGLDLVHTGKRWDASIGPRMGFGDARYMDTYFGVTPTEAARSPLINAPYEPGAGKRYTGLEAATSYRMVKDMRLSFDVGYHRLSSKAAQSPIVLVAGSRDQISGGVGVSYSFGGGH